MPTCRAGQGPHRDPPCQHPDPNLQFMIVCYGSLNRLRPTDGSQPDGPLCHRDQAQCPPVPKEHLQVPKPLNYLDKATLPSWEPGRPSLLSLQGPPPTTSAAPCVARVALHSVRRPLPWAVSTCGQSPLRSPLPSVRCSATPQPWAGSLPPRDGRQFNTGFEDKAAQQRLGAEPPGVQDRTRPFQRLGLVTLWDEAGDGLGQPLG